MRWYASGLCSLDILIQWDGTYSEKEFNQIGDKEKGKSNRSEQVSF